MVRQDIALLSQETIDKIAAGEVVERPASVVKELTENALDAGSNAITIEIKDGGTSLIRITDNGAGIPSEQIPLAFLRHSTSKIRSADDLLSVRSLGFRGEALSSIAAVSRVELITKTEDEILGSHYIIEGSKEISMEEIGAPNGTSFFVQQLFYNTPARKKFLKSAATEASLVEEVVVHLAISHPEVSFRFLVNGKEKLYTAGNNNLNDVIYQIYGRELATNLLPISIESEYCKIDGFIGLPQVNRGNRSYENFYINHRYIKNKYLSSAVEEGYVGFLMQHQYPFCVLNLEFCDALVDVNVHPTKMEVRFDHIDEITREIRDAIHHELLFREDIQDVSVSVDDDFPQSDNTTVSSTTMQESQEKIEPAFTRRPEPFESKKLSAMKESIIEAIHKDSPYERQYKEFYEKKEETIYEQASFLSEESMAKFQIIGQVFETYWIVEYQDKMYIIDQHAAHEKVLYERTMASLAHKEMTSQYVSPPIVISLNAYEQGILTEHMQAFTELGYVIEPFGGNEYAIEAVPGNLFSLDSRDFFLSIIAELSSLKPTDSHELIMEKVASMSCKAAVKGNNKLSLSEIEALFRELLRLENPYHCPHGRPTIIAMTRDELDKKFKRIVS